MPASTARSMSPSSFSAVTISTIMFRVAGSLLSFLQTSNPLSLGIMMSSRIRCGLNEATLSSVSCPSTAMAVSTFDVGQIGFEQFDVRLVVVGDQYATFFSL